MSEQWEYIEFIYKPDESVKIVVEASPILLEKTAKSLEKQLQILGVDPSTRPSEYQKNQFFFFHTSRVDMLNALGADGWELISTISTKFQESFVYQRLLERQSVENKFSFADIVELVEVSNSDVANGYLRIGWVLIETSKQQFSEHGYSVSYCLAWSSKKGEPTYPEIRTEKELLNKALEEWANKDSKE